MSEEQEFVSQESPEVQPQNKSTKKWIIGGCGLMGVLIVAALVLFVIFDPFGLIGLLFGGGKIAAIVPDDTLTYIEMDLLAYQSEDLGEIIEAFEDAAGDTIEDEQETFEDTLEESLGVSMEEIIAWIGRHVGIVVPEFDPDDLVGADPPVVFILEVRDADAADEFIADVVDHREDEFDEDFDEFDFDGATFYDNEEDYESVILGRYKDYVFFATDVDALEDILDLAEQGRRAEDTLAKSELYKRTMAELPGDRLLTLFLNYEELISLYSGMYDELNMGMAFSFGPQEFEAGVGVAIAVVEAGIQLDVATVYADPDDLPWSDLEIDMDDFEPQMAGMVPESTFLYAAGYIPEGYGEYSLEMLGEDYLEALELLGDDFGIDIEDLFASLEGEVAFALFEQDEGFLAEFVEMPIGFSVLIGTNDPGEWEDVFEMLTEEAGLDSMTVIEEVDLEGFDLMSMSMDDGYDEYPFMVYGTGETLAILSTLVEDVEVLIGEEDSLADADDFQAIWSAFPDNSWPTLYLDVEELIDFIENFNESGIPGGGFTYTALEPLTKVAAASTLYASKDSRVLTVIFFIDR